MNEREEIARAQAQLDGMPKPFTGNLGTPVQAIEFALKVDDHYEMRAFLESWQQGDLTEWPEYQDFIREDNASITARPIQEKTAP